MSVERNRAKTPSSMYFTSGDGGGERVSAAGPSCGVSMLSLYTSTIIFDKVVKTLLNAAASF